MLFFKSKKKKEEKAEAKRSDISASEKEAKKAVGEESFEKDEIDYENPSLMDIAMIIQRNGYTVYSHDQGRKNLDKRLKENIK